MPINEIMSKCVVECTEDATLEQVYELIRECEHGLVVVIESQAHRVPIGVVSERSICDHLILRGKNPRGATAGAVLDARIRIVRESDPQIRLSSEEKETLAAIVVTDDNRRVCGIVPKERLAGMKPPLALTRSEGRIYLNTNPRTSPASSEIPAFGWIN